MGLDTEDHCVNNSDWIATYVNIVNSILADVQNGDNGILVLGAGKTSNDLVTRCWNEIVKSVSGPILGPEEVARYVNGPSNILSQTFEGAAMIAVVSSHVPDATPSGGLTDDENDALTLRADDIREFVKGGGGLLGFSQLGLAYPHNYLKGIGIPAANFVQYTNITPTAEGAAAGFSDVLDLYAWHETYKAFPSFLHVLATNNSSGGGLGQAAAIGGTYSCPSLSANADSDGDILQDPVEVSLGTDPCDPDTDSDGLLDSWECGLSACGFDLNGDGDADDLNGDAVVDHEDSDAVFGPYSWETEHDVREHRNIDGQLSRVYRPDPLRKDVFLEIDWLDCGKGGCPGEIKVLPFDNPLNTKLDDTHHAPDVLGLSRVRDIFAYEAPAQNADGRTGITFHYIVDERVKHDPNCDRGTAAKYDDLFGTDDLRDSGQSVLAAKKLVFRYVFSGHSAKRDHNPSNNPCENPGTASLLRNKPLPDYDFTPFGTANVGGRDIIVSLGPLWICDNNDCFGQVGHLFPDREVQGQPGKEFDQPMNALVGDPPSEGVTQLWARTMMHLLGHSLGIDSQDTAHTDVVNNDPTETGDTVEPYDSWRNLDWDNLQYTPGPPGGVETSNEAFPTNGIPTVGLLARRFVRLVHPMTEGVPHLHSAASGGLVSQLHPAKTEGLQSPFLSHNPDPDGDGVPENGDNCPGTPNENQANLDGDLFGDACDGDIDQDGLLNEADSLPFDTDNDGVQNSLDSDDDGDGAPDTSDNCTLVSNSGQANGDGDNAGDACDVDDDNDGFPDGAEQFAGSNEFSGGSQPEFVGLDNVCTDALDQDQDGLIDGNDEGCVDGDSDTTPNFRDNCPSVPNPGFVDQDGDGQGDDCDQDDDNDGVSDPADSCPATVALAAVDANGCSNAEVDADGDTICDPDAISGGPGACTGVDNCPSVSNVSQTDSDADLAGDSCDNCPSGANATQLDADSDDIGDECDSDIDGDGVGNAADTCPSISDATQVDVDGDGKGNDCDNCSAVANASQANDDQDAHGSACDNCPSGYNPAQENGDADSHGDKCDNCQVLPNSSQANNDGDGLGNACDNCPNATNLLQVDSDGDAAGNACDLDDDNDGVADVTDNCRTTSNTNQANFDLDSYGDVCDIDDDNDGIADAIDADDDNDGVFDIAEGPCGGSTPSNLRPERIDVDFPSDDDGDTLVNEALPVGAQNYDCDGDGWTGNQEKAIFLATVTVHDQDPCGNNGWPAELSGNDNKLNIADFASFLFPLRPNDGHGTFNYFNHTVPDPGIPSEERWNLSAGNAINIADLNAINPAVNAPTARPPMFGGQPAFFTNLGECPWQAGQGPAPGAPVGGEGSKDGPLSGGEATVDQISIDTGPPGPLRPLLTNGRPATADRDGDAVADAEGYDTPDPGDAPGVCGNGLDDDRADTDGDTVPDGPMDGVADDGCQLPLTARETCINIIDDGVKNADEDAVVAGQDRAMIDITVGQAPSVSGIPASRPMSSWQYSLNWDVDVLDIRLQQNSFLILAAGGASPFTSVANAVPDAASPFTASVSGAGPGETGPGVLSRVTIEGNSAGLANLTLTGVQVADTQNAVIPVDAVNGAQIAVSKDLDGDGVIEAVGAQGQESFSCPPA